MQAVQIICEHPEIRKILSSYMNIEKDEISWSKIPYGELPGGYQIATSWAFCLFCDEAKNLSEFGFRDPFDGFSSMDRNIQVLVFKALAKRHKFLSIE